MLQNMEYALDQKSIQKNKPTNSKDFMYCSLEMATTYFQITTESLRSGVQVLSNQCDHQCDHSATDRRLNES